MVDHDDVLGPINKSDIIDYAEGLRVERLALLAQVSTLEGQNTTLSGEKEAVSAELRVVVGLQGGRAPVGALLLVAGETGVVRAPVGSSASYKTNGVFEGCEFLSCNAEGSKMRNPVGCLRVQSHRGESETVSDNPSKHDQDITRECWRDNPLAVQIRKMGLAGGGAAMAHEWGNLGAAMSSVFSCTEHTASFLDSTPSFQEATPVGAGMEGSGDELMIMPKALVLKLYNTLNATLGRMYERRQHMQDKVLSVMGDAREKALALRSLHTAATDATQRQRYEEAGPDERVRLDKMMELALKEQAKSNAKFFVEGK
jgi:hypothetical protein